MPVRSARTILTFSRGLRAGVFGGTAALAAVFACNVLQNATANGDTRTISFHHIHLKEDTKITYKVNGRFVPAAMEKVNHALRDWRTNQPTAMDPELIDALWEIHRATGSQEPIHVIGGYRAPATNAMLRRRSSGVAKFSQHMRGKAIDFFIPDVELEAVREAGLRLRKGGVGFYPSSGAPFIHMDTGSVRHWPRMPEAQLAKVLSKGPLTQLAANMAPKATKKTKTVVVAANADHDDDEGGAATRAPVTGPRTKLTATVVRPEAPAPKAAVVAAAPKSKASAAEPSPAAPAVADTGFNLASASTKVVRTPAKPPLAAAPPESAEAGGFNLASASTKIVSAPPRPAQATSLVPQSSASANEIVNQRGHWQGIVESVDRPTPPADIPLQQTAAAESPVVTGSVPPGSKTPFPMPDRRAEVLAYAPATASVETRPTGKARVIAKLPTATPQPDTTVAVKSAAPKQATKSAAGPTVRVGDRVNNPWMRAMMISPSALDFMNTSLYGATDFSYLRTHIVKPATSVMMTFSDDPHLGMSFDQFRGNAVFFVSTVTFSRRTAALRQ